jgi:molecular chaperone GrpE
MTQGGAAPGSDIPCPVAANEPLLANEPDDEDAAAILEADFRELAAERDELRGTAQRIQADFENYRKRMARDQIALSERATEGLVEAILPALDGLEMALASLGDADDKVRKGVELAVGELVTALERHGLARIADPGVAFDPNQHEAVLQDDGDGEPLVGDVLRTGYALKGRVLRPAMVKVVRSNEKSPDQGSSEESSG